MNANQNVGMTAHLSEHERNVFVGRPMRVFGRRAAKDMRSEMAVSRGKGGLG
jgi:hypothetical protein